MTQRRKQASTKLRGGASRRSARRDERDTRRRNRRTRRPYGREEVVAAVLDAATTLFAERGPGSVSVRDIATRAGVNHALVHRHFGSKLAVQRAVQKRAAQEFLAIADRITDLVGGLDRLYPMTEKHGLLSRALARSLLDGIDPRILQPDFPGMRRLVELVGAERGRRGSATDARIVAGAMTALVLGWFVFEPFVLTASGLDGKSIHGVRRKVVRLFRAIVGAEI